MNRTDDAVNCHWLTPTRLMPHPYWLNAGLKPWSCMHDRRPRPLDASALSQCATCTRWEQRTFDSTKRDMVFEAWGVGIPVPEHRTFDEVRSDLVLEAWGVRAE